MLCGKISPPSGIFLLKNWANYRDTLSFEEATPPAEKKAIFELPVLQEHEEPEQDATETKWREVPEDEPD